MALSLTGSSPDARALVSELYDRVVDYERQAGRRRRRQFATGTKLADALDRFVGDLLHAGWSLGGSGYAKRTVGASTFTHSPVKYDTFQAVRVALKGMGLLEERPGTKRYAQGFEPGTNLQLRGKPTAFKATESLLSLARRHSIDGSSFWQHFRPDLPDPPVVLRERSMGRGEIKERGRTLPVTDWPDGWESAAEEVRKINRFLSGFDLAGANHFGYVRIFTRIGGAAFRWNAHGRLYSVATMGSYQQVDAGQRLKIRIAGDPVAEVDIRASHATIHHGLRRLPFIGPVDPDDPYLLGGFPRSTVKAWMTATLGNGSPIRRWSAATAKDLQSEHSEASSAKVPSARQVGDAVMSHYPALAELADQDLWASLQFVESEIILRSMLRLMDIGVPSLSVHDALLVRASDVGDTQALLKEEFFNRVGVAPILTVKTAAR